MKIKLAKSKAPKIHFLWSSYNMQFLGLHSCRVQFEHLVKPSQNCFYTSQIFNNASQDLHGIQILSELGWLSG